MKRAKYCIAAAVVAISVLFVACPNEPENKSDPVVPGTLTVVRNDGTEITGNVIDVPENGSVVLKADHVFEGTAPAGLTYQWQVGNTNVATDGTSQTLTVTASGMYKVIINATGHSALTSSNTVEVRVAGAPITGGDNPTVGTGRSYAWRSIGGGTNIANQAGVAGDVAPVDHPGIEITVTVLNGTVTGWDIPVWTETRPGRDELVAFRTAFEPFVLGGHNQHL